MNIAVSKRTILLRGNIYDAIEDSWYSYFKDHNLTFIANRLDQDFDKLAENVDCFVITGGDNKKIRRSTERRMTVAMMKLNKPVIGICHGAFFLTKFLGGKLDKKEGHRTGEHTVTYKEQEYLVNSSHRYYIKSLPSNAQILATDADGDPEAWIDHNFAGVVWHPERLESGWIPTEIAKFFEKTNP
jgi:gamma-glutamyl-gamma-aminobutyrate hydrolase PuuD